MFPHTARRGSQLITGPCAVRGAPALASPECVVCCGSHQVRRGTHSRRVEEKRKSVRGTLGLHVCFVAHVARRAQVSVMRCGCLVIAVKPPPRKSMRFLFRQRADALRAALAAAAAAAALPRQHSPCRFHMRSSRCDGYRCSAFKLARSPTGSSGSIRSPRPSVPAACSWPASTSRSGGWLRPGGMISSPHASALAPSTLSRPLRVPRRSTVLSTRRSCRNPEAWSRCFVGLVRFGRSTSCMAHMLKPSPVRSRP